MLEPNHTIYESEIGHFWILPVTSLVKARVEVQQHIQRPKQHVAPSQEHETNRLATIT